MSQRQQMWGGFHRVHSDDEGDDDSIVSSFSSKASAATDAPSPRGTEEIEERRKSRSAVGGTSRDKEGGHSFGTSAKDYIRSKELLVLGDSAPVSPSPLQAGDEGPIVDGVVRVASPIIASPLPQQLVAPNAGGRGAEGFILGAEEPFQGPPAPLSLASAFGSTPFPAEPSPLLFASTVSSGMAQQRPLFSNALSGGGASSAVGQQPQPSSPPPTASAEAPPSNNIAMAASAGGPPPTSVAVNTSAPAQPITPTSPPPSTAPMTASTAIDTSSRLDRGGGGRPPIAPFHQFLPPNQQLETYEAFAPEDAEARRKREKNERKRLEKQQKHEAPLSFSRKQIRKSSSLPTLDSLNGGGGGEGSNFGGDNTSTKSRKGRSGSMDTTDDSFNRRSVVGHANTLNNSSGYFQRSFNGAPTNSAYPVHHHANSNLSNNTRNADTMSVGLGGNHRVPRALVEPPHLPPTVVSHSGAASAAGGIGRSRSIQWSGAASTNGGGGGNAFNSSQSHLAMGGSASRFSSGASQAPSQYTRGGGGSVLNSPRQRRMSILNAANMVTIEASNGGMGPGGGGGSGSGVFGNPSAGSANANVLNVLSIGGSHGGTPNTREAAYGGGGGGIFHHSRTQSGGGGGGGGGSGAASVSGMSHYRYASSMYQDGSNTNNNNAIMSRGANTPTRARSPAAFQTGSASNMIPISGAGNAGSGSQGQGGHTVRSGEVSNSNLQSASSGAKTSVSQQYMATRLKEITPATIASAASAAVAAEGAKAEEEKAAEETRTFTSATKHYAGKFAKGFVNLFDVPVEEEDIMERRGQDAGRQYSDGYHLIPWDQRSTIPADDDNSDACSCWISPRFWERIDWSVRCTALCVVPTSVLTLVGGSVNGRPFVLPGATIVMALWVSQPTFGRGLKELYLAIKGGVPAFILCLLLVLLGPGNQWYWLGVFCAAVFVVALLSDEIKKPCCFFVACGFCVYFVRLEEVSYRMMVDFYVDLLIGLAFGCTSFFLWRINWAMERAKNHVVVLGNTAAVSISGICSSFWTESRLDRELNLVRIRQLKHTSARALAVIEVQLSDASYEPHRPHTMRKVRARRDVLKQIMGVINSASNFIEVIAENPQWIATDSCLEMGKLLSAEMAMFGSAMDAYLLRICDFDKPVRLVAEGLTDEGGSTTAVPSASPSPSPPAVGVGMGGEVPPEAQPGIDKAAFIAAKERFSQALDLARQQVMLENNNYKPSQSDILLGFFLCSIEQMSEILLKFDEPLAEDARSVAHRLLMLPVNDVKDAGAKLYSSFRMLLRGTIPRDIKESLKLALAMGLSSLVEIATDTLDPMSGAAIIPWVYAHDGQGTYNLMLMRVLGTVIGSIVAFMGAELVNQSVTGVILLIALFTLCGAFVQTSREFSPAGNAFIWGVVSIAAKFDLRDVAIDRFTANVIGVLVYFVVSFVVWPNRMSSTIKEHLQRSLKAFRQASMLIIKGIDENPTRSRFEVIRSGVNKYSGNGNALLGADDVFQRAVAGQDAADHSNSPNRQHTAAAMAAESVRGGNKNNRNTNKNSSNADDDQEMSSIGPNKRKADDGANSYCSSDDDSRRQQGLDANRPSPLQPIPSPQLTKNIYLGDGSTVSGAVNATNSNAYYFATDALPSAQIILMDSHNELDEFFTCITDQEVSIPSCVKEPTLTISDFPEQQWVNLVRSQKNLYHLLSLLRFSYETFARSHVIGDCESIHWGLLSVMREAAVDIANMIFSVVDLHLLMLEKVTVVPTHFLVRLRGALVARQIQLEDLFLDKLTDLLHGDDSGDALVENAGPFDPNAGAAPQGAMMGGGGGDSFNPAGGGGGGGGHPFFYGIGGRSVRGGTDDGDSFISNKDGSLNAPFGGSPKRTRRPVASTSVSGSPNGSPLGMSTATAAAAKGGGEDQGVKEGGAPEEDECAFPSPNNNTATAKSGMLIPAALTSSPTGVFIDGEGDDEKASNPLGGSSGEISRESTAHTNTTTGNSAFPHHDRVVGESVFMSHADINALRRGGDSSVDGTAVVNIDGSAAPHQPAPPSPSASASLNNHITVSPPSQSHHGNLVANDPSAAAAAALLSNASFLGGGAAAASLNALNAERMATMRQRKVKQSAPDARRRAEESGTKEAAALVSGTGSAPLDSVAAVKRVHRLQEGREAWQLAQLQKEREKQGKAMLAMMGGGGGATSSSVGGNASNNTSPPVAVSNASSPQQLQQPLTNASFVGFDPSSFFNKTVLQSALVNANALGLNAGGGGGATNNIPSGGGNTNIVSPNTNTVGANAISNASFIGGAGSFYFGNQSFFAGGGGGAASTNNNTTNTHGTPQAPQHQGQAPIMQIREGDVAAVRDGAEVVAASSFLGGTTSNAGGAGGNSVGLGTPGVVIGGGTSGAASPLGTAITPGPSGGGLGSTFGGGGTATFMASTNGGATLSAGGGASVGGSKMTAMANRMRNQKQTTESNIYNVMAQQLGIPPGMLMRKLAEAKRMLALGGGGVSGGGPSPTVPASTPSKPTTLPNGDVVMPPPSTAAPPSLPPLSASPEDPSSHHDDPMSNASIVTNAHEDSFTSPPVVVGGAIKKTTRFGPTTVTAPSPPSAEVSTDPITARLEALGDEAIGKAIKVLVLSNGAVSSIEAFIFGIHALVQELGELEKALLEVRHVEDINETL